MNKNPDTITIDGDKYVKQAVVIDGATYIKQTGPSKDEIEKADKLVEKATITCLVFSLLAAIALSFLTFNFFFTLITTSIVTLLISRFYYLKKHIPKDVFDAVFADLDKQYQSLSHGPSSSSPTFSDNSINSIPSSSTSQQSWHYDPGFSSIPGNIYHNDN